MDALDKPPKARETVSRFPAIVQKWQLIKVTAHRFRGLHRHCGEAGSDPFPFELEFSADCRVVVIPALQRSLIRGGWLRRRGQGKSRHVGGPLLELSRIQRLDLGIRGGGRTADRGQELALRHVDAKLRQEARLVEPFVAQHAVEHRLAEFAVGAVEGWERPVWRQRRPRREWTNSQLLQLEGERGLGNQLVQRLLSDLATKLGRRFLTGGQIARLLGSAIARWYSV